MTRKSAAVLKPKPEPISIPAALRAAAEREGSLEALRAKLKMSGGLFYGLLRGEPPKKLDTLRRLKDGGVIAEGANTDV
jgi:hypothetical protein